MKKLRGVIRLSGILALLLANTVAWAWPGDDSSSKLLGKWEMIAGEQNGKIVKLDPPYQVIEFFNDKTLDFHGISFAWTVLEDGRIKLTMSLMGVGAITYASLQGDLLKIPDPNFGNAFRHYRKKQSNMGGAKKPQSGFAEASDKDFFPYNEGSIWAYDTIVEGDSAKNFKMICRSLSPIETETGRVMIIECRYKWPATGKEVIWFEWYMNDSKGLNLIGISKQLTSKPIINSSNPQYIVYYPITVGSVTKWEVDNFLRKRVVESLTGAITVPSGKYKDCLVINKKSTGKNGSSSATIWYAKNVGLVKMITTHKGRKETAELVYYSDMEK